MLEKLCLKWNDFQNNINTAVESLRENSDFADVTLVSEDGQQVAAHKVNLTNTNRNRNTKTNTNTNIITNANTGEKKSCQPRRRHRLSHIRLFPLLASQVDKNILNILLLVG